MHGDWSYSAAQISVRHVHVGSPGGRPPRQQQTKTASCRRALCMALPVHHLTRTQRVRVTRDPQPEGKQAMGFMRTLLLQAYTDMLGHAQHRHQALPGHRVAARSHARPAWTRRTAGARQGPARLAGPT